MCSEGWQYRECLERRVITVKKIARTLTSLPADDIDEHKQFLESHLTEIFQAPDHSQLFGVLDFHWNYQNYQLLDYLIQEFDLEGIKSEMNIYKEDLRQFRKKTPLKLFCRSQKKRHMELPQKFHEMVVKFDWPDNVTLEVVEQFRQEYASHYSLRECAMMLNEICPGSFIVTWFIPGSIVEKLKAKVPVSILKKHSVTNLQISGELVYPKTMKKIKDNVHFAGAQPEMSEIVLKNANAIAVVTQVKEALEGGDMSTGYRLFGDTKRTSISIIEETEHLLERMSAMEKHYKELEDTKSRKVGELYKKETETQKEKEAKIASMRSKESELRQAQSELTSANENLNMARRRREEAERRKRANIAGAVGLGVFTLLTLGLASPLTVPGAVAFAVNAVEASSDKDQAERDINHARNKISQCEGEISQYRGEIRQLDNEITALSQQIRYLKSERETMHAQRGGVSDTIQYLHNMLYFWKEFGQLTECGTDHATFLQKLSDYLRLHNQHTASFLTKLH